MLCFQSHFVGTECEIYQSRGTGRVPKLRGRWNKDHPLDQTHRTNEAPRLVETFRRHQKPSGSCDDTPDVKGHEGIVREWNTKKFE